MTRILVVEHEANAGIGLVGERIRAAGAELVLVGPETGTEVPESAAGYDGVIVLGGTPGPTDDSDAAWLPRVRDLIADSLLAEIPFLGICLGAQMLAVVAGGVVGGVRKGAEVGLSEVSPTAAAKDDALFGGLAGEARALQWHFLEVHELPPAAVSLCTSERCPNQAFRVGAVAWGVQFHLEALAATAAAWARDDNEDLRAVGLTPAGVVAPMVAHEAELRARWSEVADRWLGVVSVRASSRLASATTRGSANDL